nr:fibronectin type III domain-containing protein [Nakamurella aerolata]
MTFDPAGTISVTPKAGSRKLQIAFTVADATGDQQRQVTGTLIVQVLGKPDTPQVPRAENLGSRQVTLTWSAPADNGSPITGYLVQDASKGYRHECAASPCNLTDLTNNVGYRFTLTAVNAVGQSKPSSSTDVLRPDAAPDPPGRPTLKYGNGSLQVAWKEPANEGSPITGYDVEISPAPSGGGVRTVKGVSTSFDNLSNGTEYSVRVKAKNSADAPSDWSEPAAETPATKPETPSGLAVSSSEDAGQSRSISVNWKPGDTGGDQPEYTVTYTVDGATKSLAPTTDTSATIPDVQFGSDYSVTVQAENKAGKSGVSDAKTVKPYIAPEAPTGPKATATGDSQVVELSWGAPSSTNGYPLDHYAYSVNGGDQQPVGKQTSATVSGLQNGQDAKFTVYACTAAPDQGLQCSQPSESVTANPYGPPSAPSMKAVESPKAGQLAVSWDPAPTNGRDLAEYRVFRDGKQVYNGTNTSFTDTGLTNGQDYSYTVRQYTNADKSNFSEASAPKPGKPYDVPAAPPNLDAVATGNNSEFKLTWGATADGGDPITKIEVSVNGGGWEPLASDAPTSANKGGLENGTNYTFKIRAVNQRGSGAESNTTAAKYPYGPIGPVNNLRVTGQKQDSVTFSWDDPADNGVSPRTGAYTFAVDQGNLNGRSVTVPTSCGKDVTVTVTAKDAQGHGPGEATSATGTAAACPPPPPPPPQPKESVTMKHGAPRPCQTGGGTCYYLAMDYSNLPGGTYNVCFQFDNNGPGCWKQYSVNLSGNGSWSTNDVHGYDGAHYGQNQRTKGTVRLTGPATVTSPPFQWG